MPTWTDIPTDERTRRVPTRRVTGSVPLRRGERQEVDRPSNGQVVVPPVVIDLPRFSWSWAARFARARAFLARTTNTFASEAWEAAARQSGREAASAAFEAPELKDVAKDAGEATGRTIRFAEDRITDTARFVVDRLDALLGTLPERLNAAAKAFARNPKTTKKTPTKKP